MLNFCCYYFDKSTAMFRYLGTTNDTVYYAKKRRKIPYYNTYEVFTRGESSDITLREFKTNLEVWASELKNNNILDIDFFKYNCTNVAIKSTFHRLFYNYKQFNLEENKISTLEYKFIQACNNSALYYCEKGKPTYDAYGYDFSSKYPSKLSEEEMEIPIKTGKGYYRRSVPKKFKMGYYKVVLKSSNKYVNMLFNFSRQNVYFYKTIEYYKYLCAEFETVEDIQMDDNLLDGCNVFLYNKDDIHTGDTVFKNWFTQLKRLKDQFPKNKLIKHLSSSLWGQLCAYQKIHKTAVEIEDDEIVIGSGECEFTLLEKELCDDDEYYVLLDNSKPFRSNLARIKPMLTSLCVIDIGKVAIAKGVEEVIRINTDCVVFKSPFDRYSEFAGLLPEEKSTGRIQFMNVMRLNKV